MKMTAREKKARREIARVLRTEATADFLQWELNGLHRLRKALRRIGDELGSRPMPLPKRSS